MPNRTRLSLSILLALATFQGAASAGEIFPGPVEAHVLRVVDGDTFLAEAIIWPGQTVRVSVRLRGVDAPETKGRCEAEKIAGKKAAAALEGLIGGATVKISNISGGKYYGRVLADVALPGGESLAEHLLLLSLVREYSGGKRRNLCELAATGRG